MLPKPVVLADVTYRPTGWLWPGFVPIGLSLLAGRGGVGKSSLVSDIAARVTTGRPFPGEDDVAREPAGVLIACGEEDKECAPIERAQEQGADLRRILITDDTFVLVDRLADMEPDIRRHSIRLIALDPLTNYLRYQTGQPLRVELQTINAFARANRVALIGIAHFTKAGGKTVLTSLRGGGQFSEVARHVTAVARHDPSSPTSLVVFGVAKSNLCDGRVYHGFRIARTPETNRPRLTWAEDDELPPQVSLDALVVEANETGRYLRSKVSAVEAALIAALSPGPQPAESIIQAVIRETHASPRTIDTAKKNLGIKSEKEGPRWFWRLPAPGEEPDTLH